MPTERTYTLSENPEYTILNVKTSTQDYNTVVDTKYVKYLELFSWNKINTEKGNGSYFGAENTKISNRLCVEKLKLPFEYGKQLLLHRLVAHLAGLPNPENYPSVDHINRETLDNRAKNLRWLSQADQNRNTGKRNRKVGSQALPDDISKEPLPKYVTWYMNTETTKAGTTLERKFFRIEKHPAQTDGKSWSTSKSSKFTNQQKLDQAKLELARLDGFVPNEDPLVEELRQEYFLLNNNK